MLRKVISSAKYTVLGSEEDPIEAKDKKGKKAENDEKKKSVTGDFSAISSSTVLPEDVQDSTSKALDEHYSPQECDKSGMHKDGKKIVNEVSSLLARLGWEKNICMQAAKYFTTTKGVAVHQFFVNQKTVQKIIENKQRSLTPDEAFGLCLEEWLVRHKAPFLEYPVLCTRCGKRNGCEHWGKPMWSLNHLKEKDGGSWQANTTVSTECLGCRKSIHVDPVVSHPLNNYAPWVDKKSPDPACDILTCGTCPQQVCLGHNNLRLLRHNWPKAYAQLVAVESKLCIECNDKGVLHTYSKCKRCFETGGTTTHPCTTCEKGVIWVSTNPCPHCTVDWAEYDLKKKAEAALPPAASTVTLSVVPALPPPPSATTTSQ